MPNHKSGHIDGRRYSTHALFAPGASGARQRLGALPFLVALADSHALRSTCSAALGWRTVLPGTTVKAALSRRSAACLAAASAAPTLDSRSSTPRRSSLAVRAETTKATSQ